MSVIAAEKMDTDLSNESARADRHSGMSGFGVKYDDG